MPRISPLDPAGTGGRTKTLLEQVRATLGGTPNLIRTLAQAPAALDAYLSLGKALSDGAFTSAQREQIALAVAGENSCDYCASAHTLLGRNAGLADEELAANLRGQASDPRMQALLDLARAIVQGRGFVSDAEFAAARNAGITDAEIVELVAEVTRNIFTNYLNHLAQTEVDFPLVPASKDTSEAAAA